MLHITTDLVRGALACIPSDDRDLWLRVGMALHSEFPDDTGFGLFDAWSQGADTYRAAAVRDTWRSFKPGGRITIGTLLGEAKARGFKPTEPPRQMTEEERSERQQKAAKKRALEEAKYRARADRAERDTQALWDAASDDGASPYLARKGVRGHGVRYLADGTTVAPMRDIDGKLRNVQRIAPRKPDGGATEKRYMPGGRKSGLFHVVGDLEGGTALALVCEGLATGFSLRDCTGRTVVVAFDAGNLAHVAKALRERHPTLPLLVCGDDDRDTETRTGKNPGRAAAAAAARAVGGAVVFPDGLPAGGSDFNDQHQHAGAEAVRAVIERAAAVLLGSSDEAMAPAPAPAPVSLAKAPAPPKVPPAGENAASDPAGGLPGQPDRFTLNAAGVWFTEHDREGRARAPMWVCSCLKVTARTRDGEGDGWGYFLEFDDPTGKPRTWAMPARMLAGDGTEKRATLLGMGLRIAAGTKARNQLTQYLQTRQPDEVAQCTDRVGWHGHAFVLPRETIQRSPEEGDEAPERIVYQTDGPSENPFKVSGSLEVWRQKVAKLCVGNSRLVFAVSCAFAGPLMRPAGLDSGGFHLRGDSSCGKTTALRVAASVYGAPGYMQRWRATDNALEAVAAQHCDGLLILDELAQVDPKTAGECAYMLANESSKARSTRTGQTRQRLTWRLLFLSAGEIGLAAHMAEGGKRALAGQELRMVDIPAEVTPGSIFEVLHGYEGGAVFAPMLAKASEAQHGHVGRAWLAWLVDHADTLRGSTRERLEALAAQWVPESASGQVHRVGRRFAIAAVAGEMATAAGLTGWSEGEATAGARACFQAWLTSRPGGIGNTEDDQMLRQVRRFFEQHGEARFSDWSRASDDHAPKTMHRAGFRRAKKDATGDVTSWEYFVFVETFREEVCQGFAHQAVLRVLRDGGYLQPDKGRPFDSRVRLPGLGNTQCYRVLPSIFDAEGSS